LEAGSSFKDFKSYNPFALSRSAGVGLCIHASIWIIRNRFSWFDAVGKKLRKPILLLDNIKKLILNFLKHTVMRKQFLYFYR
jgi:hypothetical protein